MALFDEGPREAAASMLQCFGGLPEGALRTPTRGRDQGTWKHSSTMVNQFGSGTRRFRSLPLATNTLPAAQKETLVLVRNGVFDGWKSSKKNPFTDLHIRTEKETSALWRGRGFQFPEDRLALP
jgi:hypothetical protein